ncbi:hypothetical protein BP5796_12005 [Coleophoma crateriformis]|uniref:Heterokaryon incompatibility domain-containing protein n=1 Tax=Coleophoma crateriformis TaxID=565419 RepID=A0A3D8QBH7_9HELO|nr:hypothetical protein BP5796_12005 [Coleophoma crateriformis]
MPQIYRDAKEVLAWLGPFAALPYSHWYNEDEGAGSYIVSMRALSRDRGDGGLVGLVGSGSKTVSVLTVLKALLNRSYWQRTWVIQEITLASTVFLICGDFLVDPAVLNYFRPFASREMEDPEYDTDNDLGLIRPSKELQLSMGSRLLWDIFRLSVFERSLYQYGSGRRVESVEGYRVENDAEIFARIQRDIHGITRSKGYILDEHRKSVRADTLEELLWTCHGSTCSDPRDKIYALLGLASDCQSGEIEVDYSKSLFEVYKDVVCFYGRSHSKPESQYMPKVVSFSQHLQRVFGSEPILQEMSEEENSKMERFSTGCIKAQGILTGTVFRLKEVPKYSLGQECRQSSMDATNLDDNFFDSLQNILTLSPNNSFGFFPVCTTGDGSWQPPSVPSRTKTAYQSEDGVRFLNFQMENGRTGIISANARKGDIICQFLDCDVGAVLRKHSNKSTFSVVGRAIIRKSEKEGLLEGNLSWDEVRWRQFTHSVPYFDQDTGPPMDRIINLELDIVTLQQLTR